MSVVLLQLGQCGNQVGQELLELVSTDGRNDPGRPDSYRAISLERFFRQEAGTDAVPIARAVLVDMEPKVISQTLAKAMKSGQWSYGNHSYFCQKQGSGNNWANGFCIHGPRHEEAVLDLVRREVEQCERFGGFIAMMSLAGGTGSGLGTYITQCLRDMYPNSFILNQLTWPYGTGEISFTDINKVIAHQLGSVLQPVCTRWSISEYGTNPLGDLLESLVTHPEYKLLSLMNIPLMSDKSLQFSTFTWPALMKNLRQMLIANAKMEAGIDWQMKLPPAGHPSVSKPFSDRKLCFNTSLANLLVLRGKEVFQADTDGFKEQALYTSWMPADSALSVWRTSTTFSKYEKSASIVSNSQCLQKSLDRIVTKAWDMFASRAYVHQYMKHGISEEDFLDCFTTVEQVIASYSSLG
ncbi:tubulin delta chain isoform X2 [Hemiscyllium ocellatum]|uniref:tubulin delta chain isoform X2 n=1 Tax=Hemiscyllium ocellatum TaxID=170820 RepID=UPI002967758D|nr:tubulin delta chain isoform X2 [Hemiscyllium ocellatum]